MLKDENNKNLIFENLRARHISLLAISKNSDRLGWLQIMLFRTWLSQAETKLKGLVACRQPRCLVAVERDTIIALILLQPTNRRGSCWSISLPEFINEPQLTTKSQIIKNLIIQTIKLQNDIGRNLIIRCNANDSIQLSIARELGFQPLKLLKKWKTNNLEKFINLSDSYPNKLYWQPLSKTNSPLLYNLKRYSESVQLREILDIQCIDLLDNNQPKNGILINKEKNKQVPILGFVTPLSPADSFSLEIIREVAWDERITTSLPLVLKQLLKSDTRTSIETSSNDQQLNNQLSQLGWNDSEEFIILGRSIWKRKLNNNLISRENSLKTIFRGLEPDQTPIPTPFLIKP